MVKYGMSFSDSDHAAHDLPVFRMAYNYALEIHPLVNALPEAEKEAGGLACELNAACLELMITIVRGCHDYMTDVERDGQFRKAIALTRELEMSFALMRDKGYWMPKLHDFWLARYMEINEMLSDLVGKPLPGRRGHLRLVG